MACHFIGNGFRLDLPSCQLGNTMTLNLRTKITKALDGTFWATRSTPPRRRLNQSWAWVNRNKALEVYNFLVATTGHVVTYVDHNNVTWKIKFVTTAKQFQHSARTNNPFALEMEVEMDS